MSTDADGGAVSSVVELTIDDKAVTMVDNKVVEKVDNKVVTTVDNEIAKMVDNKVVTTSSDAALDASEKDKQSNNDSESQKVPNSSNGDFKSDGKPQANTSDKGEALKESENVDKCISDALSEDQSAKLPGVVVSEGIDKSAEVGSLDTVADAKDTVVCTIDSSTGKYESTSVVNPDHESEGVSIDTKVIKCDGPNTKVIKCDGFKDLMPEKDCKTTMLDAGSQQNSTPCKNEKLRILKSDILASPNLSDIMNLDTTSDSPGVDSSAVNGGDELENSTDDSTGLDTTDDLITASIGLLKLDTSLKHEHAGKDKQSDGGKTMLNGNTKKCSIKTVPRGKLKAPVLRNERVDSLISESEKENRPPSSASSSSGCEGGQVDQGLDDIDGSSHMMDESFIDMIDNIDESSMHRSSINQFLNSRCSSRSRYLDESNGSFYRSNVSENRLDFSSPGVEVYYPNGLPSPPVSYKGRNESFSFCNGASDFNEIDSPSLRSFEHHEKGVKYLTKTRNGSRSSDYSSNGMMTLPEGSFQGHCQHKDLSLLGIVFQIKRVQLDDGNSVYCMWVSRDPEEPGECGRSYANLTLASSLNSTMDQSNCSLGEILSERAQSASKDFIDENYESSPSGPVTHVETEEDRAINYGPYSKSYDTLHSIGKGAFGFVKLAQRKRDKTQVVVKFIRRAKVFSDCWIQDDIYGRIPLEVSVLVKLDHPNIVRILDIFENAEFVLMVMEKHGSGMDLFEFIDRSPCMDEPLASYIFRQMVSAVSYLHSKNILHRDIKDENVIVNEQFQIKLIDFGAVAFMEPGKVFATFCGTLEYCSPEVLMGNKYYGPELEVWSLGVTLYTLVFGENPFFDVDETIKCELKPPFKVSSELRILICWLLHPEVKHRATITGLEKNCWVQQKMDITQYKWSEVLPNTEFHGNTASDNRPDSPPVPKENIQGEITQNGQDELKCNLLKQLGSVDNDKLVGYDHKYV